LTRSTSCPLHLILRLPPSSKPCHQWTNTPSSRSSILTKSSTPASPVSLTSKAKAKILPVYGALAFEKTPPRPVTDEIPENGRLTDDTVKGTAYLLPRSMVNHMELPLDRPRDDITIRSLFNAGEPVVVTVNPKLILWSVIGSPRYLYPNSPSAPSVTLHCSACMKRSLVYVCVC
jgi:hypothetical protein